MMFHFQEEGVRAMTMNLNFKRISCCSIILVTSMITTSFADDATLYPRNATVVLKHAKAYKLNGNRYPAADRACKDFFKQKFNRLKLWMRVNYRLKIGAEIARASVANQKYVLHPLGTDRSGIKHTFMSDQEGQQVYFAVKYIHHRARWPSGYLQYAAPDITGNGMMSCSLESK